MECGDVSESIWQCKDTEYEHRSPYCSIDIHDILPCDDLFGIPWLISVTRHRAILVLVSCLLERFEDEHGDAELEGWSPHDRMQVALAVRIIVIRIIILTTTAVFDVWVTVGRWYRSRIVLTDPAFSRILIMYDFIVFYRFRNLDSFILSLISLS